MFVKTTPRPNAALQLVCFPSAGSGASMYRRWPRLVGDDVEVIAVQPPGREHRSNELPIRALRSFAEELAEELSSIVDRDFVLFGHSMGALVAYETAVLRAGAGYTQPSQLVLSAAVPRFSRVPDRSRWAGASLEELRAHLQALGGTPDEVLRSEEMMALVGPAVLNDLAATDEYEVVHAVPVPVSATVVAGKDDVSVTEPRLHDWDGLFVQPPRHARLPGGHFYFSAEKDAHELLATVIAPLTPTNI